MELHGHSDEKGACLALVCFIYNSIYICSYWRQCVLWTAVLSMGQINFFPVVNSFNWRVWCDCAAVLWAESCPWTEFSWRIRTRSSLFKGIARQDWTFIVAGLSSSTFWTIFALPHPYLWRSSSCPPLPSRDAFAILMAVVNASLWPYAQGKTYILYNDFYWILEGVSFLANAVNSCGKNFTKVIVDCLWYVDGHHDTLQKQSCPIP